MTVTLTDNALFRQQCYINGRWCDADDGATFTVTNPATDESLGTSPRMGEAETRQAIDAAHGAFPAWRDLPAAQRAVLLEAWHDLMMEHQDDLGRLMTLEQGKPLAEAKGEIAYAASFLEFYGEEAKRVHGAIVPAPTNDRHKIGRAHV